MYLLLAKFAYDTHDEGFLFNPTNQEFREAHVPILRSRNDVMA